ncbi:MAG: hypothetical protein ACOX2K_01740 [Bacillota bacterium]
MLRGFFCGLGSASLEQAVRSRPATAVTRQRAIAARSSGNNKQGGTASNPRP